MQKIRNKTVFNILLVPCFIWYFDMIDNWCSLMKCIAFPSSESNQQTKDVLLFTFFLSIVLFLGCKNIQCIVISIILDYSRQIKIYKTLCIALDTIFHHEICKHICNFETYIAIVQNIVTLFYYNSLYYELLNWYEHNLS